VELNKAVDESNWFDLVLLLLLNIKCFVQVL